MKPRSLRVAALLASLGSIGPARADMFASIGEGVSLRDLGEYVGTGYGGEYAHCIRLDFITAAKPSNQFKFPEYPANSGYWISNTVKDSHRQFGVDAAYAGSLTSNGVPVAVPSGTAVAYYIGESTPYEYRFAGAGTRKVYVYTTKTANWVLHYPNGSSDPQSASYSQVETITLDLIRRDVDMVSIDSRRVYGQPNLDGELPGDPNADLRNPSFANWVYKGGLFVGQAMGNDASGTARIQGWVPTATTVLPLMSSLNLRALGVPGAGTPNAYAAPTLRLYGPSAGDANLGTTASTVTWSNKWDLAAATQIGEDVSANGMPPGEFLRFRYLEGLGPPSPVKFGLAMSGESSNMAGYWQYFASAAYANGLPLADSRPRLWTVDLASSSATTQTTPNWNDDEQP